MTLELLKVLVQPVVLERDEDGNVVGERVGEVVPLYTSDQIGEFVQQLKDQLAAEQQRELALD